MNWRVDACAQKHARGSKRGGEGSSAVRGVWGEIVWRPHVLECGGCGDCGDCGPEFVSAPTCCHQGRVGMFD